MISEAYVYVRKDATTYHVMGVRKMITDRLHLFPLHYQEQKHHAEVILEAKKVGMVNYRNIKITGSVLAKYYNQFTDAFTFQGHVLSLDQESLINISSGGKCYNFSILKKI